MSKRRLQSWACACLGAVGLCAAVWLNGCTLDGEIVKVDGRFRKVFPDDGGGYYYIDHHGQKVHLDEMPHQESELDRHQRFLDSFD